MQGQTGAYGQYSLFGDAPLDDVPTRVGGMATLQERAESYFDSNPELVDAMRRAARVMESRCGKVSARFLVEFARWLRFVGWSGMEELLGCFSGLHVAGDDVAAMPNAYSAYLTRLLEADGVKVTKAKSVMDA